MPYNHFLVYEVGYNHLLMPLAATLSSIRSNHPNMAVQNQASCSARTSAVYVPVISGLARVCSSAIYNREKRCTLCVKGLAALSEMGLLTLDL
jgi:hypothetical protein